MSRTPKERDYIRRSENPYAAAALEQSSGVSQSARAMSRDAARAEFRARENPYAHDFYFGNDVSDDPSIAPIATSVGPSKPQRSISPTEYERRVRQIFGRYVPAAARGRLPQHYRDFITRTKVLGEQVLASILAQLAKYDLATSGLLSPQFNRERDPFTIEKLAAIERAARTTE